MWLLVFLFLAATLLLGWTLFGYFLFVWFVGRFRVPAEPPEPEEWPRIALLVPCLNEEEEILAKLNDLQSLDYPRERLRVYFLDGGSRDRTCQLLEEALDPGEPFELVRCAARGKVAQLNEVLPRLEAELVVNSDADARLAPDALRWIAREMAASPEVWVVGAHSHPAESLAVDRYYWAAQNKARLLESQADTASVVVAPCYAFRRELLERFPPDVIADDVHVAFLANTEGHRSVYSRHALARETRGPLRLEAFLPHKFRKSNAFLRESLRFLYRLPEMRPFFRLLFLTRLAQQLLLPWGLLGWALMGAVLLSLGRADVVLVCVVLLFALFATTSAVFATVELPEGEQSFSLPTMVEGFALTNLIILATALSYPFVRQSSVYRRLEPTNGVDAAAPREDSRELELPPDELDALAPVREREDAA